MPAPWPLTRPTRIAEGVHLCGDHRATGSVQGALASGARAAREVLASVQPGGRPPGAEEGPAGTRNSSST
ncbi:FAD-dependent oxidoreductase [Streptomyces xanthophaeus]|uniref:FAD-dependent oxidoreductase n=1 Tax=Streptomyces xanthophaeus TaxID=67385 RepID=UPI003656E0D0